MFAALATAEPATSVRITSHSGRTGVSGTIRIVAQVVTSAPKALCRSGSSLTTSCSARIADGAPYFVEWVDENPYEARDIRAEVSDGAGGVVVDHVRLEPLELIEETQVASVLVEATVADRSGQLLASLHPGDFSLFEDETAQTLDTGPAPDGADHVHAADRRQPEHVAAHRSRPRDGAAGDVAAASRRPS
jgi:hypothetical protein